MPIRPFAPADLGSVLDLWLSGNLSAHPFLPAAWWSAQRGQVALQLPQAEVWLSTGEDGALLGFAGLQGELLAGLFVAEGARSQGVGKSLLDHLKARHPRLVLHVYQRNPRALRFYLREGFRLQAVGADAAGEPELLLSWDASALPLTVRRAVPGDLEAVWALARRAAARMNAEGSEQWGEDYPTRDLYQGDIQRGELWCAATPEGRVLGAACVNCDLDPAYQAVAWTLPGPAMTVHRAAVDPAVQRQGTAAVLLLQAMALAREAGVPSMRVDTYQKNAKMQGLFRKLGFLQRGEVYLQGRPLPYPAFELPLRAPALAFSPQNAYNKENGSRGRPLR